MYKEGLSSSTVKNYLAAIRHTQIALGLDDPHMGEMRHLEYVMKRLASAGPQRPHLLITPDILRRMKVEWERAPERRDASMLWVAATMCFFGFLRAGEVVVPSDMMYDAARHLSFGGVRVDSY